MRILHFSDLHLGVENYGSLDSRTGLSTRVSDFLRVFDIIIDRAITENVDAVLFAGDAFKNRDPSPTLQREFARRIVRLAGAGIPIVIVIGNHDLPNVISRATPVEIYQVLEIPGVHVCRSIETIRVATKAGPLQVVALPWVTRSLLLAEDQYREMGDVDFEREMASLISQAVRQQAANLNPSLPAVLVAHVSLQGASLGFEQSIMLGRDVTVGLDDLQSRGFDYIAMGHIHKHQALGVRPPAVYAGSPERIDFGEEHEAKGYIDVRIEQAPDGKRATIWSFEELPARRFLTLRLDARGEDPQAAARRDVDRRLDDVRGAIVRCFIEVDPGRERSVATQEIRRALLDGGAAYVAHVIVESETVIRARQMLGDEHARDSTRMLGYWLEGRKYEESLKQRVLELGGDLIQRRAQETGGTEGPRG
jgi:DNA repair protein SbcD/Mre11